MGSCRVAVTNVPAGGQQKSDQLSRTSWGRCWLAGSELTARGEFQCWCVGDRGCPGSLRDSAALRVLARACGPSLNSPRRVEPGTALRFRGGGGVLVEEGEVLGDEALGHAGEQRELFAHLGWMQIRRRCFGVDQISDAGVVFYNPATMTHRDLESQRGRSIVLRSDDATGPPLARIAGAAQPHTVKCAPSDTGPLHTPTSITRDGRPLAAYVDRRRGGRTSRGRSGQVGVPPRRELCGLRSHPCPVSPERGAPLPSRPHRAVTCPASASTIPSRRRARASFSLRQGFFVVALAVGLLVWGLLIFVIVRYRWRRGRATSRSRSITR